VRRILKITGKTLLGVVCFLLLYLGSAWLLSRIAINREADTTDEVTIYILTNGVHTDIVVPARNEQMDWTKEVRYTYTRGQDTTLPYLAMAWGAKGFYLQTPTWADLKFSVAFKAAFGLSTSAMHTTYYAAMRESASCKRIGISKTQYARLAAFIIGSFRHDPDGHFIHINTSANYGSSDAFYEGIGRYNLFYTCNTWANSALKHGGQKCCLLTIFDTGIFLKYEK
jgi:uncharacterized protein (TIGR02117 family)